MMEGSDETLNRYFTDTDLLNMSMYEKIKKKNQIEKYNKLREIGLNVKEPEFMKNFNEQRHPRAQRPEEVPPKENKKKSRRRKPRCSSDEEDEWLPNQESKTLLRRSSVKVTASKETAKQSQAVFTKSSEPKSRKNVKAAKIVTTAPADNASEASGLRYPKRVRNIPNYKEPEVPDCDDFIFCDECDREWEGDCPVHPLQVIRDNQVPKDVADKERGIKTTPPMLAVDTSKIPEAGLGVWARKVVPYRARFGPYEGTIVPPDVSTGYGWLVFRNGKRHHCIDATEPGLSNWMRYVNCARHKDEQNLFAFQFKGDVYYRTTRNIAPLEELFVYYGDDYGQDLGISPQKFSAENKEFLEELIFDCRVCKTAFSSPVYLQRHRCHRERGLLKEANREGNAQAAKNRPFVCQNCQARFTQKIHLVEHIRCHTKEKPFSCEHCQKKFRQKSTLNRHIRCHTKEKPFSCEHCQKKFRQKTALNNHIRCHTKEKPFSCEHCQKKFRHKFTLNNHIRCHTKEKPFSCEHCQKKFRHKFTLNEHIRCHTKEKPFSCEHCQKKFRHKFTLNNHIRCHTKEKPFSCEHCQKKFRHKFTLNEHIRCHTKEKPFSCEHCQKKFRQKSALNKHIRCHTKENPFECEL